MLGVGRELVDKRWPTLAPADAMLADQSVALQPQQMRAHGVVGQTEGGGQVVDSLTRSAQKRDDLAAGGREEAPAKRRGLSPG